MDEEGTPLFLPHVELWLKAMRSKLLQWSGRLLAQVAFLLSPSLHIQNHSFSSSKIGPGP